MGTTVLYVAGAAIVLIAGIGHAVALRRRQAGVTPHKER